MWVIEAVVCLLAALLIQLSVIMDHGSLLSENFGFETVFIYLLIVLLPLPLQRLQSTAVVESDMCKQRCSKCPDL